MTTSFPPINYPNKPVPPFTAPAPRNPFPGFYPDMWRNITGKPYITVSSKGLANGQSEYFNDGADFGPDSLQADGSLTQTMGIQEAVLTGKHVKVLEGIYQIYDEIVPDDVLDIEFEGFSLTQSPYVSSPLNYVQQNTSGLNIIHIKTPLKLLKLKGFAGLFNTSLTSTGHVFFVDAKAWLDANPPTDLDQTVMAGGFQITDIFGGNQDANHYVLYLENVLIGNIHNCYGNGYGGFYHFGNYIPAGSTTFMNSGNFTMSGYWMYNSLSNSTIPCNVNMIDYSCVSNESGKNSVINLITNRGSFIDINYGAIASGVAAVNFQTLTDGVGAENITLYVSSADANDTTPSGQELLFNIPYATGIEFVQIGGNPTGAVYSPNTGSQSPLGNGIQFTGDSSSEAIINAPGYVNIPSSVSFGSSINPNISQVTTSAPTSGSIISSEPFRGTSYRKAIFYFDAYENDTATDQTIDFQANFTTIAATTINTTGLTITVTTSGIIITAPDSTTTYSGIVIVEGY